jgi:hypothetical protein
LNAAGRAGRAGKETEGWIILAKEPRGPNVLQELRRLEVEQEVNSSLHSVQALQDLSEYETLLSDTQHLILANVPHSVDTFLAYCWYLADSAGVLDLSATTESVLTGLRGTLAWQQLPADVMGRWEQLASRAVFHYEQTPAEQRRRWARSGIQLSANEVLEQVVDSAKPGILSLNPFDVTDPMALLENLLSEERLNMLLGLLPEQQRRFKLRRTGRVQKIDVDLRRLIFDWVDGIDLTDLANTHLGALADGSDDGFKFEQLSGFLTKVCEHHLPWTLGIVIDWLARATDLPISNEPPVYLHFGVSDQIALTLLKGDVRSRRLAVKVAHEARKVDLEPSRVPTWLGELGPSMWRKTFDAGAGEVADLLSYLHDSASGVSADLLAGLHIDVEVDVISDKFSLGGSFLVDYVEDEGHLKRVAIIDRDGETVAFVSSASHLDLTTLIDAGFKASAESGEDGRHVSIRLDDG